MLPCIPREGIGVPLPSLQQFLIMNCEGLLRNFEAGAQGVKFWLETAELWISVARFRTTERMRV